MTASLGALKAYQKFVCAVMVCAHESLMLTNLGCWYLIFVLVFSFGEPLMSHSGFGISKMLI